MVDTSVTSIHTLQNLVDFHWLTKLLEDPYRLSDCRYINFTYICLQYTSVFTFMYIALEPVIEELQIVNVPEGEVQDCHAFKVSFSWWRNVNKCDSLQCLVRIYLDNVILYDRIKWSLNNISIEFQLLFIFCLCIVISLNNFNWSIQCRKKLERLLFVLERGSTKLPCI